MIIILVILVIIILSIILYSKKENLVSLNSEVYSNINNICNLKKTSYFNKLNISDKTKIDNKLINKYIYDIIYPIGTFYVQYPTIGVGGLWDAIFPERYAPNQMFPGTLWKKQWDTEGVFFRTEGALSDVGRSTDGIQDWAIKRLWGQMSPAERDQDRNPTGQSGAFRTVHTDYEISIDDHRSGKEGSSFIFDSSRVVSTSKTETRVKNKNIIIWKRIE